MRARIEQVHRSYRRELVPLKPPGAIVRAMTRASSGFTIPIQRTSQKADERNRCELDKFTIKSQEAVQAAQRLAHERANPEITPEHLLAVLIEQEGGIVAADPRRRSAPGRVRSGPS